MSAVPAVFEADWPAPVDVLNETGGSPFVLICEHASRHMPAAYADLGLPPAERARHIAWDIGAAEVTRDLSRRLDAPAFLATYSRLLVDLNRPFGVPSSMPLRSEATDIPGNRDLSEDERQRRRVRLFDPFHRRVAAHLDGRAGRPTVLVTIHSFTPVFLGVARPWHCGILFDRAAGFAHRIIAGLAADRSLNVAANEPYRITLEEDYAIPVHGDRRGIDAVLVEIRQDLLGRPADTAAWAARLAAVLPAALDERAR